MSLNKYQEMIRPGGLLVTDSGLVKNSRKVDARRIELPLYEAVMDTINKAVVLNMGRDAVKRVKGL